MCIRDSPMTVRIMEADSRVREDIGRAAVTRGPVVYCMEEADNGKDLYLCALPAATVAVEEKSESLGVSVVKVIVDGLLREQEPEEEQMQSELYHVRHRAKYEAAKMCIRDRIRATSTGRSRITPSTRMIHPRIYVMLL